MKKLSLTLICALAISPLLVQCASQDEIIQLNYQIRMLNKKVSELESKTIDDMQKRQALNASQIDRLHSDFLQLKSGVDETGHLNRRLKEQSKELETAFQSYTKEEEEKRKAEKERLEREINEKDRKLEMLAAQINAQQENLKAIQQARVEEAKRKAAAAAAAAEEARRNAEAARNRPTSSTIARIHADQSKTLYPVHDSAPQAAPVVVKTNTTAPSTASTPPPAPASTPAPAAPTPSSSSGAIDKGRSLYGQGKYREAYKLFEDISQSGDQTSSMIEARYMMGECLFALEEYDQAILDYQHVITNYPSSAKAPAAMLRQGMAFEKLNDKDTAKILYKKLIASYKKSPEAEKAQEKLGGQ